jgi:hypothetical protein
MWMSMSVDGAYSTVRPNGLFIQYVIDNSRFSVLWREFLNMISVVLGRQKVDDNTLSGMYPYSVCKFSDNQNCAVFKLKAWIARSPMQNK